MFFKLRAKPVVLLVLTLFAGAAWAVTDPPQRVARLSVIRGDVSYAPEGDSRWAEVDLNRPLVTGDQLNTGREARAEMDVGAAVLRLDEQSRISVRNLDDRNVQIELADGTLNLHVHKTYAGHTYEIVTPTVALVVSEPGEYRIDVDTQDNSTLVTVFDGAADVYGDGDAPYRVDNRKSYRFNDNQLRDVAVLDLPRPDDFDDWCFDRDDRLRNSSARRYVSDEVIGSADLDEYGDWDGVPEYGNVWFPNRVADDWAPYRNGHWVWIRPWGWTWVDNAPWGFAPFHYGRWVSVHSRWGWVPGPIARRPVYAPALVAFVSDRNWRIGISGGGRPVGWCPLGPRDVYVPPYRVNRGYFNNVNVSNTTVINNTHITNIYNNYASGRPQRDNHYTYRRDPHAVTAVPRDTFIHGRPVGRGRMPLKREHLERAEVDHDIPTKDGLRPATARRHAGPSPQTSAFAKLPRTFERYDDRPRVKDAQRQFGDRQSGGVHEQQRMIGQSQARIPPPQQRSPAVMPRHQDKSVRRAPPANRPVVTRNTEGRRDSRAAPSIHREQSRINQRNNRRDLKRNDRIALERNVELAVPVVRDEAVRRHSAPRIEGGPRHQVPQNVRQVRPHVSTARNEQALREQPTQSRKNRQDTRIAPASRKPKPPSVESNLRLK